MIKLLSKIQQLPWKRLLLLADQVMVSGSSFLLGILLVRWLDLEQYGVFALLWMVVFFALSINQAFISKPMLSLAPKMNEIEINKYLSALQWIQGGLSSLMLVVGIGVWLMGTYISFMTPYLDFIPVLIGIIFFQMYHDYFRKKCFIQDKVQLAFVIDAVLCLGQLSLIVILFLYNQPSLIIVFYAILIANFLSVTIAWLYARQSFSSKEDLYQTFKKQFHYSKWLLGTALLQWFSGNYFIIISATIIGPIAVGALRMVQNIMGFCHILFLSMENIVPIEAARQLHFGGWDAMYNYLKKMTIQLGTIFLVLLTAIALCAPYIIQILYGEAYLDYSYIIVVYCFLYIFVFLTHPLQYALRSIESTYPLFIAYVCATLFSLIAANTFLNEWKMAGLLAGLIITQLITLFTYSFYFIKNAQKYNSHGNHPLSTRKS